jgi:hypothetical protein
MCFTPDVEKTSAVRERFELGRLPAAFNRHAKQANDCPCLAAISTPTIAASACAGPRQVASALTCAALRRTGTRGLTLNLPALWRLG